MRAIAIVADLVFQAKIGSVAGAAGVDATFPRSPDEIDRALEDRDDPVLVIVDLDTRWLDPIAIIERVTSANGRASVVAFGSHVDVGKLQAARDAGADRALPRSAFVKILGDLFG